MEYIAATRTGDTLTTLHPPASVFSCTEPGCDAAFRSETWTTTKRSLERHLQEAHGIRITSTKNVCRGCNADLGIRPSRHRCTEPIPEPTTPAPTCRHSCTECNLAFPSRLGLRNHQRQHEVDARRRQVCTPLARPRTRRTLQVRRRQPEDDSTSDAESVASRTRSRQGHPQPTDGSPDLSPILASPAESPPPPGPIHEQDHTQGDPQVVVPPPGSPDAPADPPPTPAASSPSSRDPNESGESPEPPETDSQGDITGTRINATPDSPGQSQITANLSAGPGLDDTTEDHALAQYDADLQRLLAEPATNANWIRFNILLEDITKTVQDKLGIRLNPRPNQQQPAQNDQAEARTIQRLYRVNRRRAIRKILGHTNVTCPADNSTVEDYYRRAWDTVEYVHGAYRIQDRPEVDTSPFTEAEVRTRLGRFENTAPGPDRITYTNWKKIDPSAKTLTKMMNVCLHHRATPASWRTTETILIHKKGNTHELTNWRPISMANTAYKLYAGCWASRVSSWIQANEGLHPAQKGFTPFDGVMEHNFALREEIHKAKSCQTELCIAWLDISNAFGSLPHEAIQEACAAAGLGETFTEVVDSLISGTQTTIRTGEHGRTDPIPMKAGVKQGCPISGILFNLAIDPVLHELQGANMESVNVLAYADDIAVLARTPEDLEAALNTANTGMRRIGLHFNPAKSKTLHIGRRGQATRVLDTQFAVDGSPIPTLASELDAEEFLGSPVGFNPIAGNKDARAIEELGMKILTSKLAPWQRIDAFKTFVTPATLHHMRNGDLAKQEWKTLDNIFRAEIKRTLNLPQEAANEYIYGPRKAGLAGIQNLAETSDIALVDSAMKLLTSKDTRIQRIARASLDTTIQKRTKTAASDPLRGRYLSGDVQAPLNARSSGHTNTWTKARKASTRMKITWLFTNTDPSILVGPGTLDAASRQKTMTTFRNRQQQDHLNGLIALRSQGKAIECTSKSALNTHFMADGKYTRFADWRFIHRARLNLVPLNANRRTGNAPGNKGCRRCAHELESLPHVLNHCMRNAAAYTRRHDAILDRIHKAANTRYRTMVRNGQVPGMPGLRPDLVITRGKKAIIVDVTVAFENRDEALQAARQHKLDKYEPLANHLRNTYDQVDIEPIVVGSLGTWMPQNDGLLKKMCSRSYAQTMKKLVTSDTIRWSRDVYTEHITGRRQYEDEMANQPAAQAAIPPP